MEKIILSLGLMVLGITINAQVKSNLNIQSDIDNSNAFLDGTTSFSRSSGDESKGKGLAFPDTDLTAFEFDLSLADGQTFPTLFNGMVVYNVGTGKVGTTGTNSYNAQIHGIQVDVEPGFYYFFNPKGADNQNVSEGRWVRLGAGAEDITAKSNRAIGTFVHDGGNSAVLNEMPIDAKSITGIKIVRTDDNGEKLEGGVVSTTFYSYEKATKKLVFGQGVISTSMPAGNYRYEIEYTK